MEIVPLTSALYPSWDTFCLKSPDAWFWHTTAWIDYHLAYRPDMEQRSYSFLCKEGDRVIAIAPLILGMETKGRKVFTFSGIPTPGPALEEGLSPARRTKLFEFIFALIEGMARDLGVSYTRFQVDSLSPGHMKPTYPPFNYFLQHHYLDCSVAAQMIDLRVDKDTLLAGLRRDHARNIEKSRESLDVRLYTGAELTDAKFDEYRLMHSRAAGRVTRPLETFHMMRRWIQDGHGFLAEARAKDGKSVGFETFHAYKRNVYSMSACNEPGFERLPIRHLLQWESILWMKERGYEFYEVGDQQFGTLPYDFPDRKQVDISLFKSGFGGVTVPAFRGERFHDKSSWQDESARRAALFASGDAWNAPVDADGARALLRRIDEAGRPQTLRPEETDPIPSSARTLAQETIRDNPDALQRHRNGSTKALAFLVGAAMKRAEQGLDARLVRRALEERLAQSVADGNRT